MPFGRTGGGTARRDSATAVQHARQPMGVNVFQSWDRAGRDHANPQRGCVCHIGVWAALAGAGAGTLVSGVSNARRRESRKQSYRGKRRLRQRMPAVETAGGFRVSCAAVWGVQPRTGRPLLFGRGSNDGVLRAIVGGDDMPVAHEMKECYDIGERSWVTY